MCTDLQTPTKYVDMLTDFGFKRIFGDKELLIAFLNALFEKEGKVVRSVTYINKEMTPEQKEERVIFYDVYCKVDGGEDFILEMQHKPQDTFRERALYYISRDIVAQATGKKKWKYKLLPVYGIFITNFHLKEVKMPEAPITEIVLKNRETNELFSDKIRMFFIDLLSFNKNEEDELESDLEKWIYNIKNLGKMNTAPKMACNAPFDRLYDLAELAAMPTRQRNQYERSLKIYRDLLADKETTRNRIKISREEGREEGEILTNIKHIKRMASKGKSADEIAETLDLDIEFVRANM